VRWISHPLSRGISAGIMRSPSCRCSRRWKGMTCRERWSWADPAFDAIAAGGGSWKLKPPRPVVFCLPDRPSPRWPHGGRHPHRPLCTHEPTDEPRNRTMARRFAKLGLSTVGTLVALVLLTGAARHSGPGAVALVSSTRQARIHQLALEEKEDGAGTAAAADFPEKPASPRLQDQWWYKDYINEEVPNTQNMRWSSSFAPQGSSSRTRSAYRKYLDASQRANYAVKHGAQVWDTPAPGQCGHRTDTWRLAANYLYDSTALAVHAKGSGTLSTLMSSGRHMNTIYTYPASRSTSWPGVSDMPVANHNHLKYYDAYDQKTGTRRRSPARAPVHACTFRMSWTARPYRRSNSTCNPIAATACRKQLRARKPPPHRANSSPSKESSRSRGCLGAHAAILGATTTVSRLSRPLASAPPRCELRRVKQVGRRGIRVGRGVCVGRRTHRRR
jgi:hypothetical protein